MLGLVGQDALLDGESGRIGVKVEFGEVDNLQVRVDDQPLQLLSR